MTGTPCVTPDSQSPDTIWNRDVDKPKRGFYNENMPELSRFLGMVISIYFDDHNPPHFHVGYNEEEALISINDFSILKGDLPPRVLGLAMEWARLHQGELLENWNTVQASGKYSKIAPLA